MSTYISGGCKNGKSFYAQRVAKAGGAPLYYVATMIPRDDEDRARVLRHRQVSCNDEGLSLGQLMIAQAAIEGDTPSVRFADSSPRGGAKKE